MDLSRLLGNSALKPGQGRLQQISSEVSRIASSLAQFTLEPDTAAGSAGDAAANDAGPPEVTVETVREAIRAREIRNQCFGAELFSDPAWDMLLELFWAELTQLRVSASSLCEAAAVPPRIAMRWIAMMTDAGLFEQSPDPKNQRRIFVELTPRASEAMRNYFRQLDKAR